AATTVAQLEALGLSTNEGRAGDDNLSVSHVDAPSGSCPLVITRTYTVRDACLNASGATHTININDSTPPQIAGSIPATNVEGCDARAAPAAATTVAQLEALGLSISDACTSDANLSVSHVDAPSGSCPLVITRTYTVRDACLNASGATHTININDSTPPQITGSIPATNVEGCDASAAPAAATTVAQLEALGLSISDACTSDANLSVSHVDAPSGSCPLVITRTYTVRDACLNASGATHTININDTPPTQITGSIPATNVEGCDASAAPAAATTVAQLEALGLITSDASTSHAILSVSHVDAPSGSCPLVITRTYTVRDACLNASGATHTINI